MKLQNIIDVLNSSKKSKKPINKKKLAVVVVIAVACLLVLYALVPDTAFYRETEEKDSAGIAMLQSPSGIIYRQNPETGWVPAGKNTTYVGVGGKYYLTSYENDAEQIFLHGTEYIWFNTTAEFYRDDYSFPPVTASAMDYLQGLLYVNPWYDDAEFKTRYSDTIYRAEVADKELIADIFALTEDKSSATPVSEEGLLSIGAIEFFVSDIPQIKHTKTLALYKNKPVFLIYETDDDGEKTAYVADIPEDILDAVFGAGTQYPFEIIDFSLDW